MCTDNDKTWDEEFDLYYDWGLDDDFGDDEENDDDDEDLDRLDDDGGNCGC